MAITKAQANFIQSDAKFIRLLAPAGCGKTFSIIEKTRALISKNPKVKIAIFTFTKNAANEIQSRCNNNMAVSVNTLNSWGNNYIKANILKNPRIISGKDAKWFVLNSLQPVWTKNIHQSKYEALLTGRSRVKNSEKILKLIDEFKNIGFMHTAFTKDFNKNMETYKEHIKFINKVSLSRYYESLVYDILSLIDKKEIEKINSIGNKQHEYIVRHWIPFWVDCCEHMLRTGQYTLDDQKYFANIELEKRVSKNHKRVGAAKLDYIFIDEFQDTSPLDLMLISNLQKTTDAALIIVGDDDQAIFEFRGATPYFILNPNGLFGQKFKTYVLDENFRSPKNVVEKSMRLIKYNENRVDKDVVSSADIKNAEIQLLEYQDSEVMVDAIIDDIKQSLNTDNERVAVLSRKKSPLLPYQILLTKENIPFSVSDDLSFFYTAAAGNLNKAIEIKTKSNLSSDDLAELVCMFNKNEFYKEARNIIFRAFRNNYVTIENVNKILLFLGEKQPRFEKIFLYDYIANFHIALNKFINATTVYETIDVLLNFFGGFQRNYNRSLEDLFYKDPPLSSLLNFASKYGTDFRSFVDDFNRAIEMVSSQTESNDLLMLEEPRVILSTALRVKGQEFDKVIVLDTINGIWPCWPYFRDVVAPEEMESERRLFYVVATRCKKAMHLYRTTQTPDGDMLQISPFVIEGKYGK